MAIYSFRKIVSRSYKILLFTAVVGLASGYMLDAYSGRITALILAMVPPINGLGGNIGSVLGARLSSALHLGTVDPKLRGQDTIKINLTATASLGMITFSLIGGLFFLSSLITGRLLLEAVKITLIFFGAGMLLIGIIVFTSLSTAFISYNHGLDPDDVVIPVTTTVVDVGGVLSILLMSILIGV